MNIPKYRTDTNTISEEIIFVYLSPVCKKKSHLSFSEKRRIVSQRYVKF